MGLKSGSTTYRHSQVVDRKHQHQKVGGTYGERRSLQIQHVKAEEHRSIFGKVKDFFLGPKLPNISQFSAHASYVGSVAVTEGHKRIEQGIPTSARSTDQELVAILDAVSVKKGSKGS